MTQTAVRTIITIVHVDYTEQESIRCVARVDMPEYGIKKDQTFYLVRSSKQNGDYYLVMWNYEQKQWSCGCPATKPCRHMKLVNAKCALRVAIERDRSMRERADTYVESVMARTLSVDELAARRASATLQRKAFSLMR